MSRDKEISFLVYASFALFLFMFPRDNNSQSATAANDSSDYSVKVDVNEVRLDAVVLDKKGKQITDLKADDFELFQDAQPQKILSCKYIPYHSEASGNSEKSAVASAPSIPSAPLAREDVQRSILFLIDHGAMKPQALDQARKVLQRFVETQMQPHDAVAIIQNSNGARLQTFTSSKPELLKSIHNLTQTYVAGYDSFMKTVEFWIDALGDMPGRKFLVLFADRTYSLEYSLERGQIRINDELQRASYKALQAGVVIHAIDFSQTNHILGADSFNISNDSPDMPIKSYPDIPQSMDPSLPMKTGGMVLPSWNIAKNGLSGILEAMNGYYLITYAPPQSTFNPNEFHSIKIKAKRSGSNVLTRAGFLSARQDKTAEKPVEPMLKAMFSPFRHNDLKLTVAAGYIADESKEYVIRSWLNLDGHSLGFKKDNNKKYSLSIVAAATTADAASVVQNVVKRRFDITVNEEEMLAIMENGLRISIPITTKTPGSYYVRAAAQDEATGAIGSSYQFIEIPEFKNDLALSSIFLITPIEDLSWIDPSLSIDSSRQSVPAYSITPKNQASRSFEPGERLECAAVIYNAKSKEGMTPSLESSYILYRDGQEAYKSKPEELIIQKANKNILLKKKIQLDDSLEPGDYVLRIEVRDKLADKKKSLASQTLQFEVVEK